MARIIRKDPYLTREDTGADQGQTPAVQFYSKQAGSDGQTLNTVFTLSKPYVQGSNTLVVYLNGQKAELVVSPSDETEYEETSSSTVTFGDSLLDTDVVEFMVYGTYFIQDTDIYVTKSEENNSNIIINGDMNIGQRGTSFAAIANADYCLDRYKYGKVGTMVHTISQDTDVPTVAESGYSSKYSMLLDVTTADAAMVAGDIIILEQRVEGYNFQPLFGNYGTLSFWVKATKTGIYCVAFLNSSSDRTYVSEYIVNAADTWEKKTITVHFNETGGTWNLGSGYGLRVMFTLASGTDYHTTADTWTVGQDFATSNQVNGMDSTANNFRLAQVKLEAGQIATPFVPRPFAEELALCQRYYEKSYAQGVDPGTATTDGQWNINFPTASTIAQYIPVKYKVTKRATPTVTLWDNVANINKVYKGASNQAASVINSADSGFNGGSASAQSSMQVGFQYQADAEL